MGNKEEIYNLIEKQFSGNITEEEINKLKQWYNSASANKQLYKGYYALLKYLRISKNKEVYESEAHLAYQRFLKKTSKNQMKNLRIIPRVWMRYAAVALIAFGLGVIAFYFSQSDSNDQSLTQTIEIPFGSKSKITLPDGTSVWLNSGSVLTYQKNFGSTNREVILDGEGFFDVTKNKSLPFNVVSGKVKVKVLGTKFNFKSYEADENARVTLVEGSLKVSDANANSQGILLVPDQQAVIDKRQDKLTVKKVDGKSYALWTEPKQEIIDVTQSNEGETMASIRVPNVTLRNILFFDEEPLEQIVRDLERVFNVKIEIKDNELQSERFYGDFRNEETITQILEIMAKNNNLHYTIDNDEIIIARK